ncbi:TPA: hypothetical protein SIA35_004698 [Aeromonas sobria]|jgi:hypothetical protein|nr:hypothetical protein [Aeromonas sobria]HEH9402535.1 hypothetical protein [Aeromonas sobria]
MNFEDLIAKRRWIHNIRREKLKHEWRPRKKTKQKVNFDLIHVHNEFCLYKAENADEVAHESVEKTIGIINDIRNSINKNILISFIDTSRLTVAATVLLFAAIDEAVSNGCKFAIKYSHKNFKVNSLIKKAGIQRNRLQAVISSDFTSQKPLSIIQGCGALFREEIIDHIKSFIYEENMTATEEHIYGDAVHETINNVLLHAYPEIQTRDDKKWWMLCDVVQKELYLAIFDQGVGIPNTVMSNNWFKPSLQKLYPKQYKEIETTLGLHGLSKIAHRIGFSDISDEQLIKISMIGDLSGTHKDKHGQGSKSIKALVEEHDNGKLWIFSNKGLYTLSGKDKMEHVHSLPMSIGGTIVQWNIKL